MVSHKYLIIGEGYLTDYALHLCVCVCVCVITPPVLLSQGHFLAEY